MRIKDVAERAGVSPATVSRVLNGAASVRAEYRERVLRVIEELGYRPNRLASNLRRQKAEMIGVVVSDIENPPLHPDGAGCRGRCLSERLQGLALQHRREPGEAEGVSSGTGGREGTGGLDLPL